MMIIIFEEDDSGSNNEIISSVMRLQVTIMMTMMLMMIKAFMVAQLAIDLYHLGSNPSRAILEGCFRVYSASEQGYLVLVLYRHNNNNNVYLIKRPY